MSKRIIIPRESLPPVNQESRGYFVRFRITNENRNRFSYWSPIFSVGIAEPQNVSGDVVVLGSIISVVWDDAEERPRYDIFVKFDSGEYFYHGTSPTHSYQLINEGVSTVQVAIQIEASKKERNEFFTIYESSSVPLV
jgi:hypothetical protein